MRPFLPGLCSVKTGTAKARELDWKSLSGDFGLRSPTHPLRALASVSALSVLDV